MLITILYFLLILGVTVFIHELGHFIFAKRAGIYCYEFALGMGPKIYGFKRKNDETEYVIRLFPIGGSVKMAGEEIEEDEKIDKDRRIQSKTFFQKLITMAAGALFNFLLGIVILFIIGLIYGSYETKPYIGKVDTKYNAYKEGIREGDLILKIDGKKVSTWDDVLLDIELKKDGEPIEFEIKNADGDVKKINVSPIEETDKGKVRYVYGITQTDKVNYGFVASLKYAFVKFSSVFTSMISIIKNLIIGNLGINSLAGPVGIYNLVGEQAKIGFGNVMFLMAYLSINVGFVNLLPFPAFDGGRILFLIIEKIRKKPVDVKVENIIHTIGFVLLMIFMLLITIKDIGNIFR